MTITPLLRLKVEGDNPDCIPDAGCYPSQRKRSLQQQKEALNQQHMEGGAASPRKRRLHRISKDVTACRQHLVQRLQQGAAPAGPGATHHSAEAAAGTATTPGRQAHEAKVAKVAKGVAEAEADLLVAANAGRERAEGRAAAAEAQRDEARAAQMSAEARAQERGAMLQAAEQEVKRNLAVLVLATESEIELKRVDQTLLEEQAARQEAQ